MAENDRRPEVGLVDLPDELSAATAWGEDGHAFVSVVPHGDDACDRVLTTGDHRGYGGVLGAETGSRAGVDADTRVDDTRGRLESSGDVPEETITHAVRVDASSSDPDEVGMCAHGLRIGRGALPTQREGRSAIKR